MAPRTRSGAGRPRPTSAGDRARSTSAAPAQGVEQGVPGRGREPRREADLDPGAAQVAQDLEGAGDLGDVPAGDDRLVGGGEGGGGLPGLVRLEQRGEHVRLGPAHRLVHDDLGLLVAACSPA